MNKKFLAIVFASLYTFSLLSCEESDNSNNERDQEVDKTTSFLSGDEDGQFNTFFKPPVGWFGDPIPYFDKGKFYIYYLQDWRGKHPYLHPFHLVTSDNLSSFTYEGETLPVGPHSAQDASLCTGSVIKSRENDLYYMFYAGHKFNTDPSTPLQAVLLAVSKDLKNWVKDESFYLPITADGYKRDDMRDPFLYFDEESNLYKMIVTTQYNGQGTLALYTSSDLYRWEMQDPFYIEPSVPILECADLFKEGDWWYLIYSDILDRKVHYRYSKSQNGPWLAPDQSVFDGIAYYAGKTASDGSNRYLFGWCPTRIGDGAEDQWGGSMISHKIVSQENGTLKVVIPPAFDSKFNKKADSPLLKQEGSVTKNNDNYTLVDVANAVFPRIAKATKISASIKASNSSDVFGFILGASDNSEEKYYVQFDPSNNKLAMYLDKDGEKTEQTSVYLPASSDFKYDVKVLIERSVCVVYVNDEIAFTNRMLTMNNNPWAIFSDKGAVEFANLYVFNE